MFLFKFAKTLFEISTYIAAVINQTALKQFDGLESRGYCHRVTSKCRGVCTLVPVHNIRTSDTGTDRHAGAKPLSETHNVGFDALVMVKSEHLTRTPHS